MQTTTSITEVLRKLRYHAQVRCAIRKEYCLQLDPLNKYLGRIAIELTSTQANLRRNDVMPQVRGELFDAEVRLKARLDEQVAVMSTILQDMNTRLGAYLLTEEEQRTLGEIPHWVLVRWLREAGFIGAELEEVESTYSGRIGGAARSLAEGME